MASHKFCSWWWPSNKRTVYAERIIMRHLRKLRCISHGNSSRNCPFLKCNPESNCPLRRHWQSCHACVSSPLYTARLCYEWSCVIFIGHLTAFYEWNDIRLLWHALSCGHDGSVAGGLSHVHEEKGHSEINLSKELLRWGSYRVKSEHNQHVGVPLSIAQCAGCVQRHSNCTSAAI